MKVRTLTLLGLTGAGLAYISAALLTAQDTNQLATPQTNPPAATTGITDSVAAAIAKDADPGAQATAAVPPAASSNDNTVLLELPKDDAKIAGAHVSTTNATTEDLIDITLEDVPMGEVVKMFTRLSKANIIASPSNLVGQVTVNLTGVKWKPAMESILDMHNMALVEKPAGSGVFQIVPKQAGAEPLRVQTYFLKYAAVSNVQNVVQNMLSAAPGAKISVFPSRNAIVVRSTADNLGEITSMVEGIDKLRDQVFIEAKFMELSDDVSRNLGIDWTVLNAYKVQAQSLTWNVGETRDWANNYKDTSSKWDKRQNVDTLDRAYDLNNVQHEPKVAPPPYTREVIDTVDRGKNLQSDVTSTFDKTASDVRSAILSPADFGLILSALKTISGVSIVSNPKIIVANEDTATIHVGEDRPYFTATVTPPTSSSGAIVTYNPGTPIPVGVLLKVTPTINTESNITVRIEPELTRYIEDVKAPDGNTSYPLISKKTVVTTFMLESGKTVAIGGLTEVTDQNKTVKIPLLGDIPLIGKYLFSHEAKSRSQVETIIFVTVGLANANGLNPDAGMPDDAELTPKQVLKQQLRKMEFAEELDKDVQAVDEKRLESTKTSEKTKTRLMKQKN